MARLTRHQRNSQRGAALIMVVGLMAIMGALLVGIQYEVGRTLAYVKDVKIRNGAQKMAEVGLAAAMILLRYDFEEDQRNNSKQDYYFRIDESDPMAALVGMQNAQELWSLFTPGGMSPLAALGLDTTMLPIGNGAIEVTIEDESGKWNVHRMFTRQGMKFVDPEVNAALNGIYYILGDHDAARGIVAALIDWMDLDDAIVDARGAEKFYYQDQTPPYEPRNGPFQDLEELRAVAGVNEEVYAALLSGITVWPNDLRVNKDYKININTATPEALAFLHKDMGDDLIQKIIDDTEEGHFTKLSDLQSLLPEELWDPKEESQKGHGVFERGIATVQSRAFKIRATGYTTDGHATLEAVLDRDLTKGTMRVLSRRWRVLPEVKPVVTATY